MEPVGLAVGVAGLAGLFTSVLDAVDRVKDYKSFGRDSKVLKAQLDGHHALLERWGRDIGLDNNEFSAKHQAMLDPRTFQAAEQLLEIANTMLTSDEPETGGGNAFGGEAVGDDAVGENKISDRSEGRPIRRTTTASSNSKRARIGWMFGGKAEKTEQVRLLGKIVEQLWGLVPPRSRMERQQPEGDEKEADHGVQTAESSHLLGMDLLFPCIHYLTYVIGPHPNFDGFQEIQKMMAAMVAEQKGINAPSILWIHKLMFSVSPPRERYQRLAYGYYITQ
jgi:hypothetical protein